MEALTWIFDDIQELLNFCRHGNGIVNFYKSIFSYKCMGKHL